MTNLNLVDTFQRSKMEFIMTQPPPGEFVCRMNRTTLRKLQGELDDCGSGMIIIGTAGAYAVPEGYEGKFEGALLASVCPASASRTRPTSAT